MKKKITGLFTLILVLLCFVCLFVGCDETPDTTGDGKGGETTQTSGGDYSENETEDNDDIMQSPTGFVLTTNITGADVVGTKITFTVPNNTDSYSFINAFSIPDNYKWELHWDKSCLPSLNIVSKSVDLDEGDNTLYALFVNKNNVDDIYLYELVVHRKHEVTVSYYYNGTVKHQDVVTTHETYTPNYVLDLSSSRYRFNYWEDESGNKIASTGVFVEQPVKLYANVTTFETETITISEENLSNYVTVENVRVIYENHSNICSAHPYVEFDVVFTLPPEALSMSNVDIKVNIGGNWSVADYSSTFYSGYDDSGEYVTGANGGWHLRFNYGLTNLEISETKYFTKHFKAETSGNACNKELTYYNVEISLRGSFQYEKLK